MSSLGVIEIDGKATIGNILAIQKLTKESHKVIHAASTNLVASNLSWQGCRKEYRTCCKAPRLSSFGPFLERQKRPYPLLDRPRRCAARLKPRPFKTGLPTARLRSCPSRITLGPWGAFESWWKCLARPLVLPASMGSFDCVAVRCRARQLRSG
jgi:hypothetical protein